MRLPNEILMHFRNLRKTAGDMSLSEALDLDGEGNGLSVMDVVAQEDDMAERIGSAEICGSLRACVDSVLSPREAQIIRLRYGLGAARPKPSGRLPRNAASAVPMYRAATNVNEARKALKIKGFPGFGHVKVAPRLM